MEQSPTFASRLKRKLLSGPILGGAYNLPLGIPNDFGQPLLKGRPSGQLPLMEITFHSVGEIEAISDSTFPNYLLFKKKFIGIATDKGSTGEGVFLDSRIDNPPVTMLFHDTGESLKKLLRSGVRLADKFSDLFTLGKLANDKIKLTNQNRDEAIRLISNFFDLVDNEIRMNEGMLKRNLQEFSQLTEGIKQRDIEMKKDDYVAALLRFQWGLYDSSYPITKRHLDGLVTIYKVCGLHIPELVFIEERVGNYDG